MNRLEKKLSDLKKSGKKAVSVFLTAGFPSRNATEKLVLELEKCGVDLFEIGFPFSDPIADGRTIQKSSEISLRNGTSWKKVMETAKNIRKKSDVPLIFMSYSNPLFCRGWKRSAAELSRAGFDGAIVPDMIPEENIQARSLFRKEGLSMIYLCAPTTVPSRIKAISRASSGFIYCVSVTGVTGARKNLPNGEIKSFLRKVKAQSRLPILLGFGISKAEQFRKFQSDVDGVIIGSAMIKILEEKADIHSLIRKAKNFMMNFVRRTKQ